MPEPDILIRLRAAAGTAFNLGNKDERLNRYKLHMSDAADEIERLRQGATVSKTEIEAIIGDWVDLSRVGQWTPTEITAEIISRLEAAGYQFTRSKE